MRTVDLFSGCGGMSLGFQSAGYNIVAAFENWPAAIECYKQNFKHPVIETDLSIVDEAIIRIKKYQPDLIIGGPPCQDFSNAGNRTEGERAELTHSFAKIITAVKPKFFVMENVARASESEAYKKARKLFIDTQCGGQLHQCSGTASGECCLAGADVRQRCPRHAAFLRELVAGEVLFPQYLLDRHIHHRSYYIGAPIISQEKSSQTSDQPVCICILGGRICPPQNC